MTCKGIMNHLRGPEVEKPNAELRQAYIDAIDRGEVGAVLMAEIYEWLLNGDTN